MADDWIPMRENLHEDPAILAMGVVLKVRPECVVGYCHRFWSWASRNTADGRLQNVRLESVESVLNMPGFCALLCKVGWLEERIDSAGNSTLIVPKFDRWLSQSAKRRGVEARRKRAQRVRKMSRKCPTKNGTTGQDRTGEKIKKGDTPPPPKLTIPEAVQTPELRQAVADWLAYKAERREGYKETGLKALFGRIVNVAATEGPDAVVRRIQRAMASGWQGWDHADAQQRSNGHRQQGSLPLIPNSAIRDP